MSSLGHDIVALCPQREGMGSQAGKEKFQPHICGGGRPQPPPSPFLSLIFCQLVALRINSFLPPWIARASERSRELQSKVEQRFDASDGEGSDSLAECHGSAPHARGRGRMRHGSLSDIVARSRLPKGPSTQQELANYPTSIMNAVFADKDREHRLRELLRPGVCETVDYAGMHCEGEAKRLMFQAIHNASGWRPGFYKVPRCCDQAQLPQRVLVEISQNMYNGEMCVLQDIHDYISVGANKLLDELEPDAGSSSTTKTERYSDMWDWIADNTKSLYTKGRTSECLVHNCHCPVAGRIAHEFQERRAQDKVPGPLVINSAGTVCKDWTAVGQRAGAGGEERAHSRHMAWRALGGGRRQ